MGDRASRKERDRGQRDARPVVDPCARRVLIGARTDVASKEPVILIETADLKAPQEAPGKSTLQAFLQQRRFGGLGVITRRRGCCGKRADCRDPSGSDRGPRLCREPYLSTGTPRSSSGPDPHRRGASAPEYSARNKAAAPARTTPPRPEGRPDSLYGKPDELARLSRCTTD